MRHDPTGCNENSRTRARQSISLNMDCRRQLAGGWTYHLELPSLGSRHVDKSNGRPAAVPLTYGCEWYHNLCTKPPLEQRYGRCQ